MKYLALIIYPLLNFPLITEKRYSDSVSSSYPTIADPFFSLPERVSFQERYNGNEMMDNPEMSYNVLSDVYINLSKINKVLNVHGPSKKYITNYLDSCEKNETVKILDIGSGYGDLLKEIENIAQKRNIRVELLGIDLSEKAIQIATKSLEKDSRIKFKNVNAFEIDENYDLILMTDMLHHLDDENIVKMIEWATAHSKSWLINDLYRNALSYNLFWLFSRLTLGYFGKVTRTDGLYSIRRSFINDDWKRYLDKAKINRKKVQITRHGPARTFLLQYKKD